MDPYHLTEHECGLIRLFCYVNPTWGAIISSQLENARPLREDLCSSRFLFINIDPTANRIKTSLEVPVEIIIGTAVHVPEEKVIRTINSAPAIHPCAFEIEDDHAIGVRIHVKDGLIFELEMYSLAGTRLDLDGSSQKNMLYIVYDDHIFDD